MLNNLKALAVMRLDFPKALDFSGYQLLVADDVFSLYLERAELWVKLDVPNNGDQRARTRAQFSAE
jgi:hypothetical protein